jgi:hypothetical protein
MAAVSATRVSGQRYRGNYDFSWLFFWLEVEACVAVSVISLTAFPAVFTSNASRRPGSGAPKMKLYSLSSGGKLRDRNRVPSTDDITEASQEPELPSYPAAAATGRGRAAVADEAEERT